MTSKKLSVIPFLLILFFQSLWAQNSEVNQSIIDLAGKIHKTYSSSNLTQNRIAVTEFSSIGNTAEKKKIGLLVSEVLNGELARFENFIMIERLQFEKILDEQELMLSGLIDSKTSSEIGTLLGAQAIISGSVIEAGDYFIVNARMVDVAKGDVILSESIEIQQDDLIALSNKLIVIKKYPIDAVYRSALLPGWGQFYNDTPKRGKIYLGTGIVSLGIASTFKILGDQDYKKYQENTQESVNFFDKAESKYQYRDYALYAFAGCWTINILDAWITAKKTIKQDEKQTTKYSGIQLTAIPIQSGFHLSLSQSF